MQLCVTTIRTLGECPCCTAPVRRSHVSVLFCLIACKASLPNFVCNSSECRLTREHTPRGTRATERQGRRDTQQLTRHTHLTRSHVMPAASSSDAPSSHQEPHHEEDAAAEHGDNTGVAAAPRVLGGAPPPPSTRCTHLPHAAAGDDRTPDGGGNGAGQAAAAEDSEVEGSGSSDDGGDSSGGVERSAPTAVSRPRRRRTDKPLVLTPSAREALRQRLGGGDTRSVHARRKRGDG